MELLSGNEAIARGAWEAGVRVASAYPGTPSTETMEAFGTYQEVYAEWAPNEKVALEVALGASAAGARVLCTMKHVGVNVAADPLFTAAYTGVGGGMVVLAADDPGMHSSQNEQDTRFYARAAHVPLLEPSDSQEAYEFTREAYELSEQFDLPFFVRSTVRISHAKSLVEVGERIEHEVNPESFSSNPAKWVMMPAFARPRRISLDERVSQVEQWAETTSINKIISGSASFGVVCSGAAYQYVRDALPEAHVLKLGVTWPLPPQKLASFAESVETLYVIDEASTYLSDAIKAAGIDVSPWPHPVTPCGELSPTIIAQGFGKPISPAQAAERDLPARPPALCPGCPHRVVFRELRRAKCVITGDIGCYTLGALAPLNGMDTCVDMGASVSMSHGFELAWAHAEHRPVVAVIGDSTFAHSGLSSLMGTAYNRGNGTIAILDNRTTAMTGHQGNPFNGRTLQGRPSREFDLETIVRALGITDVQTVDPNDMRETRKAIKHATKEHVDELSVIIFRAPCVLLKGEYEVRKPYFVNASCTGCGVCSQIGCPAIARDTDTGLSSIDPILCVGCGQCEQYCNFGAIESQEGAR